MTHHVSKTFWQRQRAFLPSVVTLTAWRWRQQWLLLLLTGLGVVTAITVIASLPLFSSVMITAGLRTTLRTTAGAARIQGTVSLRGISSKGVAQAERQLNALALKDLASYNHHLPAQNIQIAVSDWTVTESRASIDLTGIAPTEAGSHLNLLQGRLPAEQSSRLEGIVTPATAASLDLTVGSTLSIQQMIATGVAQSFGTRPASFMQTLQVQIVGIFQVPSGDAYWNGHTFQTSAADASKGAAFGMLVSSPALLRLFDTLASSNKTDSLFFSNPSQIFLDYTLDVSQINGDQLDSLVNQLGTFQAGAAQQNVSGSDFHLFFPYISEVTLSSPILSGSSSSGLLGTFQNQVLISMTSVVFLTALIACLILFFVSMAASTLLEQQLATIALLRSRGASRWQIAGAFTLQSIVLCLLAGLPGTLLAWESVALLAPHFLNALDQDALNALPQSIAQLFSQTGLYVLSALLITLATLILSLTTALSFDELSFKKEIARARRRPLWIRLRLDLVVLVLALADYGYIIAAQNTQQLLNAQTQELILSPLSLLAPFFLLLAGILCFLRLFPALLRWLAHLCLGGRGLSSPLAFVQMERAPRQPMRMALLLGLATAFALFALIFSASQAQRAQDLASFEAGADFSGYLPGSVQASTNVSASRLASETALYQQIPGVLSSSVGYIGQEIIQTNSNSPDQSTRPVQLRAVDANTFARTASWSTQEASQSLSDLMGDLVSRRSAALTSKLVPAIVTSSAWQLLHLSVGTTFQLLDDSGQLDPVHYLALVEVEHIPPVNEGIESGMLVDFSTLAAVRARSQEPLNLNYAWIRTSDAPGAVAHVRQTLQTQPLALTSLADRRNMAQQDASNPLAINVLGILSAGGVITLLLALLANMLLPILSLRARLTAFAVLRALGMPPRQITRLLLWEQGIILTTALSLGLIIGLLFALVAVPALVFTGMPANSASLVNVSAIYALQRFIPVQVIMPFSLLLALLVFTLLCALGLLLMLFLALKPVLGQILRLSED